jgi:hypothetical protein
MEGYCHVAEPDSDHQCKDHPRPIAQALPWQLKSIELRTKPREELVKMESLFDSGDSHNIASVGATELSSKAVQAV